jgi:hypothetical protein
VEVKSSALPSGAATETTLSTLDGKVTACNTGAVAGTVAATQSGVWDVGTVTALTGITNDVEVVQPAAAELNCTEASAVAIKTAVEIIDDWDDGGTPGRGNVNIDAVAVTSLGFLNKSYSKAVGNRTNTTTFTLIAAFGSAGVFTYIVSIHIINNDDENLVIELEQNGGSPIEIPKITIPAYGGQWDPPLPGEGFKQTNANTALDIDVLSSGSPDYTYVVFYYYE